MPSVISMVPIVMEEVAIAVDRVTEPTRTPPPVAPAPPVAKTEAEVETYAEAESEWGIVKRRIISVNRRAPDIERIVGWHIDHLRLSRLYDDDLLPSFRLSPDGLLRRRIQAPVSPRAGAHPLNRVHDLRLLCEESVTEIGRPLNVLVQFRERVRHGHQCLYARIPRLLLGGVNERLAAEIPVALEPLARFNHLERVRAGYKYLTQQWIGIQCDRRHKVVELIGRQHLLRWRLRLRLRIGGRVRRATLLRPDEGRRTKKHERQNNGYQNKASHIIPLLYIT